MRTTRTVVVLSEHEHDQTVIRSLLGSLGQQPQTHWQYIDRGMADVVVLCVSNPDLSLLMQAEKLARAVVLYLPDADADKLVGKAFVLRKPARGRDFVRLLDQLDSYFAQRDLARRKDRDTLQLRALTDFELRASQAVG